MSGPDESVLDSPARAALLGPHAHLAERRGRVLRYPVDVCPFLAFPDDPGDADWRDLAQLAGPGEVTGLAAAAVPDGWEVLFTLDGVQMVDDGIPAAPDPEAVVLGPADVPEMLALVERTRPGPFRPRTIAMGTYLGVRRGGRLIAMAGERLHPPGWTEISAVCTDPSTAGRASRPGSCWRSRRASASAATPRSCTPRRPTSTRSASTRRSGSACASP